MTQIQNSTLLLSCMFLSLSFPLCLPSVVQRIFTYKNHTHGKFSWQPADPTHPKRGIRPMGQCTTTKTSRTHLINQSGRILFQTHWIGEKETLPHILFSIFDPSQPPTPTQFSLLLQLPEVIEAVPTTHPLLTSLVFGSGSVLSTDLPQLTLHCSRFSWLKLTAFCGDNAGQQVEKQARAVTWV